MPCSSCGRKVPEGQRRCYACQVDAPTAIRALAPPPKGLDTTDDDVATVLLRADAPHEAVDTIHQGGATGPAPFIGRDPERRRMEGAWDAVRESATMQVVVVRGPEGVGKTRFVRHCLDKLEAGEPAEPPTVLTGRPPEVDGGRGSAFEGMVRRRLDVPAKLPAEEGRRRLLEASGARMVAGSAFQAASLLGRLLHLPFAGSGALHLEGEVLERRMGRALASLIGAEAAQGPVALWIDAVDRLGPFDRRVLRQVVSGLRDHGVLIVLSGREPGNATPPGVDAAHIDLGPFDAAAARRMMCSLLSKCPDVPDELIARVQGRARGNPGAIDGAVRVLMGQGVINTERSLWSIDVTRLDAGELPEGADGLLLARIRGLPRDDRRVLEAGAIQGREFRLDGVLACLMAEERPAKDFWVEDPRRASAEEALEHLAATNLIQPGADPDQWRIADERTSDLALTGMDAPRLARWRRVVAAWHDRWGGKAGRAAAANLWEMGDRPTRAARGFKAAGDRAAEQFRGDEAIRCFIRSLELLDDADFYDRLQVRHALGDVRDDQGDHKGAAQEFEAMLRDSAAARSPAHAALALRRIGEVAGNAGDWDTARTCLTRSRALYEALSDLLGVAESLEALAQVDLYGGSRGSIAESLANVELALRLRREAGDEVGVAQSYHYLGWIHADAGRDAEAQAAYEAAIRIRREAGDRSALLKSLNNLGDIHVSFGRHEAGRRALLESLAECDAIGLASVRPTILVNLARSHLDTHELPEAADRIEQVERALEDIDDPMTQVDMHLLNSRLFQALGEQAQAVEQGEAAGRLVEKMAGTYQQGVVLRRLAELHSATLYDPVGGADATRRADGLFERSVAVLSAAGHDMELALTLDAYARFLTERGRGEEGAQMSRRAAHLRS